MQIWNTLGLSQPSLNAECEKIKRVGSSNDKSLSLSFKIKSYAEISSDSLLFLFTGESIDLPFLSIEKYPLCVSAGSINFI